MDFTSSSGIGRALVALVDLLQRERADLDVAAPGLDVDGDGRAIVDRSDLLEGEWRGPSWDGSFRRLRAARAHAATAGVSRVAQ